MASEITSNDNLSIACVRVNLWDTISKVASVIQAYTLTANPSDYWSFVLKRSLSVARRTWLGNPNWPGHSESPVKSPRSAHFNRSSGFGELNNLIGKKSSHDHWCSEFRHTCSGSRLAVYKTSFLTSPTPDTFCFWVPGMPHYGGVTLGLLYNQGKRYALIVNTQTHTHTHIHTHSHTYTNTHHRRGDMQALKLTLFNGLSRWRAHLVLSIGHWVLSSNV